MNRLRLAAQVAAVAVVAALLGLLAWKVAQGDSEVTSGLARGGAPEAPQFTLERLDGAGELSLASLRGKTVVLNFWASWCEPCKQEAPEFKRAAEAFGDRVTFLGVDMLDGPGPAARFMKSAKIPYPSVSDVRGVTSKRYGITGVPETIFIDRDGIVAGRYIGALRRGELMRLVEDLLELRRGELLEISGRGETRPVP